MMRNLEVHKKNDKYQIFIKALLPNWLGTILKKLIKEPKVSREINRKIKIMHIMRSLEIGGLENGVVNLVNNMNPVLFEFSICCIKREGPLKERLKKDVRVICLHEKEGFNYLSPFKMASLFIKEKPDIVHTHGWGGGSFYGVMGARLAGVPVVINGEHGILYVNKKRRLLAQKFLALLTDKIITVSNNLRISFVQCLGIKSEKIEVIINGVDTKKFNPNKDARVTKRKEFNLQEGDFVVGTVGRLVPIKDYQTLVYAAKGVIKKAPNTKFIFVGDGSLRKELENLVSILEIDKNIFFLGERNDIPELLNMMDLFVLTSLNEGLSNTILEAMATGKPIVATSVGGNVEIIRNGENGYLIPIRDPIALSERILWLIRDKEQLEKMGKQGRQLAEQEFSLIRMVGSYEKVYKDQVKRKNG